MEKHKLAKIIAIANQKGGVGKTTCSINLVAALTFARKKILLIDLDAQGNATMASGVNKNKLEFTITDLLLQQEQDIDKIIHHTEAGYDLLPANSSLTAAEINLVNFERKEFILKNLLNSLRLQYDYIFIDCPPSLNMLTINALVASQSILIPIQCEYYALEGLAALVQTINTVRDSGVNSDLYIEGLLRTMYDLRNKLTIDVSKQLIEHFGKKVYKTTIPRNVSLAIAPSYGQSVLMYAPNSKGAAAYFSLAAEFLRRQRSYKKSKAATEKFIEETV